LQDCQGGYSPPAPFRPSSLSPFDDNLSFFADTIKAYIKHPRTACCGRSPAALSFFYDSRSV